jgi:hypothetical protein
VRMSYVAPIRVVYRLCWLLAALSIFAAAAGTVTGGGGGRRVVETARGATVTLYGEGAYQFDTLLVGAGNRGQDLVTLLVEVPALLLCVRWYRRGSLAAGLALPGILAFFAYLAASMTFATAQNQLFVPYVAMFSVSAFALVLALTRLDPRAVKESFPPRPSPVILAAYLFTVAAALILAWVPQLLGATFSGELAGLVGPYTSLATHALDLGLVVPVVVVAAVQLLRHEPAGYLSVVVILVLNVCIGALLTGAGLAQLMAHVPLTPGEIVSKMLSFAILTLVAGGLLVALHRTAASGDELPGTGPSEPGPPGPELYVEEPHRYEVRNDESSRRL